MRFHLLPFVLLLGVFCLIPAHPALGEPPQPWSFDLEPNALHEGEYPIWAGTEIQRFSMPAGTVTASSTLAHKRDLYRAANAFDGKRETVWAEGSPGDGSGEWIAITIPSQYPTVQAFWETAQKGYLEHETTGLGESLWVQGKDVKEMPAYQKAIKNLQLKVPRMSGWELARAWHKFPLLEAIDFYPGLQRPVKYFQENARPKRIRLEAEFLHPNGGLVRDVLFFNLVDKPVEQVFYITQRMNIHAMIGTIKLKFIVETVYPGSKYKDMVMSDIDLVWATRYSPFD